jgi:hypothetical protein
MAKKRDKILVGYEVGTGEEVEVSPSHMIVTGLSQKAGKTTTLESLIKRSGKKAIVFRTKVGERSFLQGTIIPPYFKDRSDWQFIQGLVEATIKEKLRSFERAKIIQVAKKTGGNSLLEFKKKVDERLATPKLNSFEMDILTNLQAYLEIVLPKLQSITFSNKLELVEGLNIIDLERFGRDPEVQSLIIRSVLEEVLYNFKDVIVVIPECWKFCPQDRGNPCKLMIEEFIRQGAANGNFIWMDSQDMTGVDKTPLKQITEWMLGYQSEINEVKHTLDQIPLPKSAKPKPDDIMSLGTGIFYLATRERTIKTYVMPFWLDEERAKKVAMGKLNVAELDAPENMTPFAIAVRKDSPPQQQVADLQETSKRFNKELSEMSTDFFNKIADLQEQIHKVYTEVYNLKMQPKNEVDEDVIVRKVLQKMPMAAPIKGAPVDVEAIVSQVLARVPKVHGAATYEVAPLEKLKKNFLQEAKDKVLSEVSGLSDNAKRMLLYLESQGKGIKSNELEEKCFFMKHSGAATKKVSEASIELRAVNLADKDTAGFHRSRIRNRIEDMMQRHGATEQEVEAVFNHIIHEVLGHA